MVCDDCQKQKWIKVKELGIEVEKQRHSLGIKFKDIAIPEGLRLLTVTEAVWLCNSHYAQELDLVNGIAWYEFMEQPFKHNKGKWAAWFGCGSNNLYLGGDDLLNYYAARGVRFCKNIK